MAVAIASLEPLVIPAVLGSSAAAGGVGGWASARRNGASDEDVITHIVSMALLGASIAMAGFGYYGTQTNANWFFIAVAAVCGLVGMPLFDPLAEGAKEVAEVTMKYIVKKIRSLTGA